MYKTRNTRNKNKENKNIDKYIETKRNSNVESKDKTFTKSGPQINTELARITGSTITDHYGLKYAGTITIFRKDITNTLQIPDQLYYLLIVKKQWWRYEYWSNDQIPSCKGEPGIAVYDHLFYYIAQRNKYYNDIVVIYILKDDTYWFCNFKEVRDFVYKKSSWYTDRYDSKVVGLAKNLFRQEPILYL